ncbi:MAG: carboxypeptidase regulatory-like domain-containing protein [Planctomycetes bacterium]|nr:carboxypeptidase regulatory-like domain-containing protein [Planctomycetota bacterium]
MRLLLSLSLVVVLGAFALLLLPAERGPRAADGPESLASSSAEPAPAADLRPTLEAHALEAAESGELRAPAAIDGLPVAGRVEVAGGLPTGLEARVVAHAHRKGVSRLHSQRYETALAPDGTFAFVVPRGTRSVSLDLEADRLTLPDEVEVAPGSTAVVLRALAWGVVRGRVHRPPLGSAGAEPIRVRCGPPASWTGTGGTSCDDAGRFSIPRLSVGEPLELRAMCSGASAELTLAPLVAGEAREVELVLEPWQGLRGVVLDEDGVALEGAHVRRLVLVFDGDLPDSQSAQTTGADGRFELPPMPRGSFEVSASVPGRNRVVRTLRAPEDTREELRFVLPRRGTVRGRVFAADGTPVRGARVSAEPDGLRGNGLDGSVALGSVHGSRLVRWIGEREQDEDARTDDEGRFELATDSGTLHLRARAPGSAPSRALELALAPGATHEGVVLELRAPCGLRGRVLDEQGEPLRVPLTFTSDDGVRVSLLAGEDGAFEVAGLPPGRGELVPGPLRRWRYSGSAQVELTPELETVLELRLTRAEPRAASGDVRF